MTDYQKQEGGTDCGLFAIAAATAIAHGVDPTQLKFKQASMRTHLLKYFESEKPTFIFM